MKLKIEDAVNATKAAIEEGIVAGGGSALVRVKELLLEQWKKKEGAMSVDRRAGYSIILSALEKPLAQIALNAGADVNEALKKILAEVRKGKGNAGYDAVSKEIVPDMLEAGIIDPVKVTRTGLQRASSAAAIFLTTEAAIAEEPKDDKNDAPMPGMGDMDY